ncbi:protein Aster-B-like [Corticium candelabrum]|uniref:protein Aster-B-like n=1 Tax=Corticium candelabrum TaxID=121492 RepID=UPI002E26E302|nr:protein Aster-B-like [Corticium candelabrum]
MSDTENSPHEVVKSQHSLDIPESRARSQSTPITSSLSVPLVDEKGRKKRRKHEGPLSAKPLPSPIGHALTMFNSSHKKRNDDLHSIFKDVPENEKLVDDCSCALQKEILLHGRLYLTAEAGYFHSNLFGYETRVEIKWVDVTQINKSRTAIVIPNAVEIHTQNNTKYGFSSLLSRDTTYTVLFKVWQNALMGKPQTCSELIKYARQLWRDKSRTGLTSDSEQEGEFQEQTVPDGRRKKAKQLANQNSMQIEEEMMEASVVTAENTTVKQSSEDQSNEDRNRNEAKTISPGEIPEADGRQLINEEFQFSVDTMFKMLFTETPFMTTIWKKLKNTNIRLGDWQASNHPGTTKSRQVNYVVPLNYSIGPKSAETEDIQNMLHDSQLGLIYHISCEVVTKNVPYSDAFSVNTQYCFWKVAPNRTHLRLNACVKFKKSPWGVKGMIERNAHQGVAKFAELLTQQLHSAEASDSQANTQRRQSIPRVNASYKRKQSLPRGGRRLTMRSTSRQTSTGSSVSDDGSVSSKQKYIYWSMALLVLFVLLTSNFFLYYRLSTFQTAVMEITTESNLDPSLLLGRHHYFYLMELERWKSIATMSVNVLAKINASLIAIEQQINVQVEDNTVK